MTRSLIIRGGGQCRATRAGKGEPVRPLIRSMIDSRKKIKSRQQLRSTLLRLRRQGKRVVFTNGCFDLIHPGHVRLLERAGSLGDILIVGLNSDASVRALKGRGRPVLSQGERAQIVAALSCVSFVTVFDEETPASIIQELLPDVLVKGGDWPADRIVGRDTVESHGGKVVSIDFEEGFSSSRIIERIRGSAKAEFPESPS